MDQIEWDSYGVSRIKWERCVFAYLGRDVNPDPSVGLTFRRRLPSDDRPNPTP